MKHLTIASRHNFCVLTIVRPARRWVSHSSSSLTEEVLLGKVDARLNEGARGEKISVDTKKRTIKTAVAELPLSPLFDPAWIKSRRRQSKWPRSPSSGTFQRQLRNNIFANALATPWRYCAATKTSQPRYLLQQYEIVRHPDTGDGWFAPSNTAFYHVAKNNEVRASGALVDTQSTEAEIEAEPDNDDRQEADTGMTQQPRIDNTQKPGIDNTQDMAPQLKCYTTAQKSVIDLIGSNKKLRSVLMGIRSGMSMNARASSAVWRGDMSNLVLARMRREAVIALIQRAAVKNEKFVQPCSRWEDIKDVDRLGCILWLPQSSDETTARQYATYDIQDAKYGAKVCVHNLVWMLGEEETATLRAESDVFREHNLLVLKTWKSKSMQQLHMLLWSLQGFLDVPES